MYTGYFRKKLQTFSIESVPQNKQEILSKTKCLSRYKMIKIGSAV